MATSVSQTRSVALDSDDGLSFSPDVNTAYTSRRSVQYNGPNAQNAANINGGGGMLGGLLVGALLIGGAVFLGYYLVNRSRLSFEITSAGGVAAAQKNGTQARMNGETVVNKTDIQASGLSFLLVGYEKGHWIPVFGSVPDSEAASLEFVVSLQQQLLQSPAQAESGSPNGPIANSPSPAGHGWRALFVFANQTAANVLSSQPLQQILAAYGATKVASVGPNQGYVLAVDLLHNKVVSEAVGNPSVTVSGKIPKN